MSAFDGDSTKQVSCTYITNAYDFTASLVNNSGASIEDEIFVSTAQSDGINIKLAYDIAINATVSYSYVFNNGTAVTGEITDKDGNIVFPVDSTLFDESNAGFYTATIAVSVKPENQSTITENLSISFSLVPEDLYLLVMPEEGEVYTIQQTDGSLYDPGYITFKYRVYQGANRSRTYPVVVTLNGNTDSPIVNQTVVERQENSFKLYSIQAGENYIDVTVTKDTVYTARYYFYIKENDLDIDWFDTVDGTDAWESKYYYRISEVTAPFTAYKDQSYISRSALNDTIQLTGLNAPDKWGGDTKINTHIAIGLQYNSINQEGVKILTLTDSESAQDLVTLYQDHIVTLGTNNEDNIYIKKQEDYSPSNLDQFHLIQIYSQYCKKAGNTQYYMISVYIDGILEHTFPSLISSAMLVTDMTIGNFNGAINLLEIDYKQGEAGNNCDYEVYKYYLKYKNQILGQDVYTEY